MKRSLLLTTAICILLGHPSAARAADARRTDIAEEKSMWDQFRGDHTAARAVLDGALMRDPSNVKLNFLNGLTYDSQSTHGSEGRQLAKVGYFTALRADPTYWPANYQLGLLSMEDGNPLLAEQFFVAAANQATDEKIVFYALARAAYCAGDAANARTALLHALSLADPGNDEERTTAALVFAANGDAPNAQKWLSAVATKNGVPADAYLAVRVNQLLSTPAGLSTGQVIPAMSPATSSPAASASAAKNSAGLKMAIVDVVIIKRVQSQRTSSGLNLLDALTLQLGGTLVNAERSRSFDRLADRATNDTVTTDYGLSLTVPAITYSLNIANSGGDKSAIQARPTILVYDGKPSKVFSGGTLTYAASGQLSSQSFTKEVGLSLSVTPTFNPDSTVTLNISTTLETFSNSGLAGSFREAVQTEKSSTDVIADLKFGQTVLVSAGLFNNLQSGSSETPVMGNIPILGGLFKKKYTATSGNDLMVLLSLRSQGVGVENDTVTNADRTAKMADELWRRMSVGGPAPIDHIAQEDHHDYYLLANPGRAFETTYLRQAGLSKVLPH